jgi:hypothetical protein
MMNEEERNTATDEAIAVMRKVGERGLNAEKMSWTLTRLMVTRPVEHHAHNVLAQELHQYLINTATMIKSVKYLDVRDEDG